MASRTLRRRAARHRHWLLVAACLGVAFAPIDLRRRARAGLLDAHVRLAALVPGGAPAAAAPLGNRARLLEAEVTRLRRALLQAGSASSLVASAPKAKLIPAEVLPITGAAGVLWRVAIDRGEQDGVRVGLPVLSDGVLVGRVASVTAATSEVLLLADPAFRVRASIARPDGDVEGLLLGTGAATLRLYTEADRSGRR